MGVVLSNCRQDIPASGNFPAAAATVPEPGTAGTRELLGAQCVEQPLARPGHRLCNALGIGHQRRLAAWLEGGGCLRHGGRRHRPALTQPTGQPAVQDRHPRVAERGQHPPGTRHHHGLPGGIEHHMVAIADTQPRQQGGDLCVTRQGVRERAGRVRQVVDHADMLRAGNVGTLPVGPAAGDRRRPHRLRRRPGRAVENPDCGIVEMVVQPVGGDQQRMGIVGHGNGW